MKDCVKKILIQLLTLALIVSIVPLCFAAENAAADGNTVASTPTDSRTETDIRTPSDDRTPTDSRTETDAVFTEDEEKLIVLSPDMIAVRADLTLEEFAALLPEEAKFELSEETEILKTGIKVTVTLNEETYEYTVCVKGDVSGDGKVLAEDARLALRQAVELEELEGAKLIAAQTAGDSKITAEDARAILRVAVELETKASILVK